MKDGQDPRSVGDMNRDGVTGHSIGTTSRADWITENMGKTVIIIIAVIIIFSISLAITTSGSDDDSDSQASQQQQAGER